MPTSVAIAGIVGFVLGATINITGGLICGGMFALIMWSLTGFRIGNPASAPTLATSPQATTAQPNSKPPDISSLSPSDIGRGLAISLDTSCKLEAISENERSLIQAANISIERYYREILVLSGFAQDYAIFRLVGHSEVGKQVLAGYREAWENVGKSGPAGAALFQLFVKRCPEYAKAAREDEEASKDGVKSLSRLTLVLGGNIQSSAGTPVEAGSAQMLAMAYGHTYYFAHFQGTAEALRTANLPKWS
jgi:hypothetical protein